MAASIVGLFPSAKKQSSQIMTVNGLIASDKPGKSLIHEHIPVDFIGADKYKEAGGIRI